MWSSIYSTISRSYTTFDQTQHCQNVPAYGLAYKYHRLFLNLNASFVAAFNEAQAKMFLYEMKLHDINLHILTMAAPVSCCQPDYNLLIVY